MRPADPRLELVLRVQPRDIGGFAVRRALPTLQRRRIGPFVFLDHLGPTDLGPGEGLDVGPHPHVGLATVTYLFDGAITHRDSLGSLVDIRPSDVNWMQAGRGIVHSERSPAAERVSGQRVHGVQSWVALPTADEYAAPTFQHHPGHTLPRHEVDGVRMVVIAGTAFGLVSPVRVASPTLYVDGTLEAGAAFALPTEHAERALYIVEGSVSCAGETLLEGDLAVVAPGAELVVVASCAARLMLLGGAPLLGERMMRWNFVASTKTRLDEAEAAWRQGNFPAIVGDDGERIPMP